MAGHSKWANTKFRKEAQDQKRGKLFTRFIREITIATKQGGPDPSTNPRLRAAIDKALSGNLTRDAIERAIKRVVGGEDKDLEEISYEGYGPGGTAVMVECLTDNHTRAVSNVRHMFTKYGGNLGVDGSVSYLFTKEGHIILKPKIALSVEQTDNIMETAINLGVLDFERQDGLILITTEPKDLHNIKLALEKTMPSDVVIESAEIATIAKNYIKPENLEAANKIIKFLDALEDLDDVQNVYSNVDFKDYTDHADFGN
ncbi:MAG: YebC/PmpR family DNA-binding transcriptional regulator [Gammaproteobacteria bacterium]|jgi:YebC/PmpR family DNA-binding regulatory protein